jgi:hypothetical protein
MSPSNAAGSITLCTGTLLHSCNPPPDPSLLAAPPHVLINLHLEPQRPRHCCRQQGVPGPLGRQFVMSRVSQVDKGVLCGHGR